MTSSVDCNCKFSELTFSTPAISKAMSKLFSSQGCSYDKNCLYFSSISFCFRCKFLFHEKRRASQVWQWRDFLGPIKVLLLRIATVDSMVLSIKILLSLRNVKVLSNKLDMLIYCTLQKHVQQATYANLLWVTCECTTQSCSRWINIKLSVELKC